jgi:hypothetical protein
MQIAADMAQSAALKQMQSPSLLSYPQDYFFSSHINETSPGLHSSRDRKQPSSENQSLTTTTKPTARDHKSTFQPLSSFSEGSPASTSKHSPSAAERSASEDDMDEFYALEPLEEDSLSDADATDDQLRTPASNPDPSERGSRSIRRVSASGGTRHTAGGAGGAPPSTVRRRRLLSFSRSPWPVADGWEVHLTPTHGASASRRGTTGRRRPAYSGLHGIGEDSADGASAPPSPADGVRTQLARRMMATESPAPSKARSEEAATPHRGGAPAAPHAAHAPACVPPPRFAPPSVATPLAPVLPALRCSVSPPVAPCLPSPAPHPIARPPPPRTRH